ncbi:MAG: magnesium chelatase subunit I [Bacteroidia bacterium]|jgi:magnesium chelatase subunit I
MKLTNIKTLGELKKANYKNQPIHDELRTNLIEKLRKKEIVFPGVWGYESTVIPALETAILSKHTINLLGLRGQAKTRLARLMVGLLDEYIPVIEGSELNDHPFHPISSYGKRLIAEKGDETPIAWLHRDERYIEKLATPDVSIADLIGDIDPIKAINEKLQYNDERVIHYGIIPRANRCIFVMNEIPDLQPRIQVALFNILQEGDVQIRGFNFRIHPDTQFVFTANPEDYTNRGSIVTPLKDRIGSQILTHYPKDLQTAKKITKQEINTSSAQLESVIVPELLHDVLEELVFEARANEFVDQKSGVSARLSISAYENLISTAERRAILSGDKSTRVRISDIPGIIPGITGKVEMVYEGEVEGPYNVALILIGKAIRSQFVEYFPAPDSFKKDEKNPYAPILQWFENGHSLSYRFDLSDRKYAAKLNDVEGLANLVDQFVPDAGNMDKYLWMEFVLFGLAEYSKLGRKFLDEETRFSDLIGSYLG